MRWYSVSMVIGLGEQPATSTIVFRRGEGQIQNVSTARPKEYGPQCSVYWMTLLNLFDQSFENRIGRFSVTKRISEISNVWFRICNWTTVRTLGVCALLLQWKSILANWLSQEMTYSKIAVSILYIKKMTKSVCLHFKCLLPKFNQSIFCKL